jgi:hypothetical protein
VQVIGAGRDQVKFGLDPIAEYLAGLFLLEKYSDHEQQWREFLSGADTASAASQTTKGFLLAVRDCCLVKEKNFRIPDWLVNELELRVDPANAATGGDNQETLV